MSKQITAAESMAQVLQKVRAVGKDSKNQQQNFNYRGIDAVVNAVHPALSEVGGFIVPTVLEQDVQYGTTKSGGRMTVVRLKVQYAWHGTDGGEPIVGVVPAEAFDTADKATAKAMSVAFRTYLLQALMLPTDDPDPDSEYIERGHAVQAPAEWRSAVAGAQSSSDLNAIYGRAKDEGWLSDDVVKALTARKEALNVAPDSATA